MTYEGLRALQHRGEEAAGIAITDGGPLRVCKNVGLVSQTFDAKSVKALPGHAAIGHTRYSTTGAPTSDNAQPVFRPTAWGGLALAHNGNLTNAVELAARLDEVVELRGQRSTSDSDVIVALLALYSDRLGESAAEVLQQLQGAFSLVFMDQSTLYAARDPYGVRPLMLGKLSHGWVVASEAGPLDIIGAEVIREIDPGELVSINDRGFHCMRFAPEIRKGCLFEYVYFARPDTEFGGRSVYLTRLEIGRQLAREAPAPADIVVPTPESGTTAALGYAEQSGTPFVQGLVRSPFIGRTFIQPSQSARREAIRVKFNPIKVAVEGKRLVLVDDSIVRGNTQRELVRMLRRAGAKEIHIRICSPPVRWPCFYGIDFPSRAELIASQVTMEGIRNELGADSLAYLSLGALIEATTIDSDKLCHACFDGHYPIPLPRPEDVGKYGLERIRVEASNSTLT